MSRRTAANHHRFFAARATAATTTLLSAASAAAVCGPSARRSPVAAAAAAAVEPRSPFSSTAAAARGRSGPSTTSPSTFGRTSAAFSAARPCVFPFVGVARPCPSPSVLVAAMSSSTGGGEGILSSFPESERSKFVGTDVSHAMEALAEADAVCFDVDSTIIQEEGVDVLAESIGKGKEVSEWTARAMEGDTKFEDALAARLDIMRPSRSCIERCLRETPLRLTPGVEDLIDALNGRGTAVYFVSGGFRIMIEPLARKLDVKQSKIYANTILFDDEGNYAGFDDAELTSADMGKRKALYEIKEEGNYEKMVMVGDGVTDMQAKPPADAFVGFGGVAVRHAVRDGACWFVTDFDDVIEVVRRGGRLRRKEMEGR